MAIDPKHMLKNLIERNPGADQDAIVAAITEESENNPALNRAIIEDLARDYYLVMEKIGAGKRLTAKEKKLHLWGKQSFRR